MNHRQFIPYWKKQLAELTIGLSDTVLAYPPAYYAVKKRAEQVYSVRHLTAMTPAKKASVSKIIDAPERAAETIAAVGGRWKDTGQRLTPAAPLFTLPACMKSRIATAYSLVVYVRSSAP